MNEEEIRAQGPATSPPPGPKRLSAAEWGALRAAEAPLWSDRTWRQACAALNIRVVVE